MHPNLKDPNLVTLPTQSSAAMIPRSEFCYDKAHLAEANIKLAINCLDFGLNLILRTPKHGRLSSGYRHSLSFDKHELKKEFATSSVTELHRSTITPPKPKSQPFVPFGAEPVEELKQDKIAYGIPWLGLAALFISVLTIISSWLILHFINGHAVFTNKLLKPAVSTFQDKSDPNSRYIFLPSQRVEIGFDVEFLDMMSILICFQQPPISIRQKFSDIDV